MASIYGRHEERSTLALITTGFQEFSRTSGVYLAKVPLVHKLVAVGTLVISTILVGGFHFLRGRRMVDHQDEGLFHKIKKYKVVKVSLNAVDRLLHMVESLIVPRHNVMKDKQSPKVSCEVSSNSMCNELNGLPKLLNLRHISSSNGTPCNQQKPSDAEDWTPFSSVSTAVDESVFDRSCVSLMEDLSQSTISTPIRDLRQQMASKIRAWRLAIQDLEDIQEFPSWSPSPSRGVQNQNFFTRILNSLSGWLPLRLTGSANATVPGSGRKRKRLDADDDDLALYIPHYKGQSKLNGGGLLSSEATEQPPTLTLSMVPIIGNWFSPVQLETTKDNRESQLDHISLIQRDCDSPLKQASNSTSDSDPYEIIDTEASNGEDVTSEQQNEVPVECP
ncbi:uncharacterized protein LOC124192455 [Daphnia pulex]|uniref:uncharacterized protein LOC124192455 n=1 Tax=Daphnia pulex TaxID=6669 RepID=UPI001EDEB167|nr:uncharacterized protein LOC124192455 [Daphnia pulex]